GGLSRESGFDLPFAHHIELGDAAGLALVCLAGFIACPYLDLTFHRARQLTSDNDAKFAFGIGFGVFFASMIVLTLFYAQRLSRFDTSEGNFSNIGFWLLATHWLVQMTYTVHVHAAELQRQAESRDDAGMMRSGLGLWLAIALAAGLGMTFGGDHGFAFHGRSFGEAGYRIFMSFYGLLFPAYVLLAIGERRVSLVAWLGISAIASPFYWLAFLEGRMPWAIAGVGVIVAGAVFARQFTPAATVSPTE
ncbi:MAG: hypothetical protein JWM57_1801, partial [Phycisphaerales bacterium]|nr:hypothetical protein [Phycisphaerales bacterium]